MYENRKDNFDDFRKDMYDSFKSNGILDNLKANARAKIFSELKKRNSSSASGKDLTSIRGKIEGKDNNLIYKFWVSIINDFLKKNEMAYTMSVLIPESSLGSQTLTKSELEEVLKLNTEPLDKESKVTSSTSLLQDIVEAMRRGQSIRPNQVTWSVQTEEGEEGLTLDQKLKKVDLKYMEASAADRVMPYKVMEERMLKYKRECDERWSKEIQAEVAKIRDIEISHIRLEEAASYRAKLSEFRNELDTMHKQKLKELKLREWEILERWKTKDREIESAAFEHRQKVLRDLEMLRYKEQETKKTVEMELLIIKNEREKLFQKEKEADLKLKDLNLLKAALEKKTYSDIDEFKRTYESKFDDSKRDIQIRRMQLEEDEHRFSLNKETFLTTQKDKTQLEKEHFNLKEKFEKISSEHEKMTKEYIEMKDQMKYVSSNGLRDNEIINTKTAEAKNYENEAKTLRELLEAQKQQLRNEKETNQEIIDNQKYQLKEQKEILTQVKKRYDEEIERIVGDTENQKDSYKRMHKNEEYRLKNEIDNLNQKVDCEQHLSKELTIVNDKLMRDSSYTRNRYDIDEIQREGYVRGDTANYGVRQTDFLTNNGIPIITNMHDPELGEEYLERQKAWDNLDNKSRDIKRTINKIGLVPISEKIYQPYYDLEQESDPITYEDSKITEQPQSRVKFDTFSPAPETNTRKMETSTPTKRKVTKEDLENAEREREQRLQQERDQAERDRERRRQEVQQRETQQREIQQRETQQRQEKERKDREARLKEEQKKSISDPVKTLSTSVKNPFAKKMTSGRKLDPVPLPQTNIGGGAGLQRQVSDGIKDEYDFNFGGNEAKKDQESIGEDISAEPSGNSENSYSDEFNF